MKHFNKIATVCGSFVLGLLALAGCEDEHFYEVDSPDWLSEKVDSIANSQNSGDEELVGMMEDVYTIGSTDYSTGFWTVFSKYYQVPDGQKWNAVFNLHINPDAPNTYKNFGLVITNDVERNGEGYLEYGVIRFDNQPSGNSEWGDYIDRSYIQSTLTFETDTDEGVEQLGGKVTLTVDRTNPDAFNITMTNGTVTKTYKQPTALVNLNADASNTNIRCFLVPEGSYIDFQQTNIEPIGGCTSAEDKNPVSMELQNVPEIVNVGTPLDTAMVGVTALVTFEEGVSATVTAADLTFTAIPDMETPGVKNLVAVYNKTFKGENCDQPITATATFEVVEEIASIAVATQPSRTTYYYYTSAATEGMTDRTLAFDPTGMEVTATYVSGGTGTIANSRLTFSTVPATVGTHTVTITADEGVTATVEVTVAESAVSEVTNSTAIVGAEDNSTAFWGAFSDDFNVPSGETKSITFTNYSSLAGNWNNYVVVLRKTDTTVEYGVVRADNYGWGAGYDGNTNLRLSGGQPDWAAWLATMNGAEVTVYVTNCGNGTADVQAIMNGTDGTTSIQYYLGITTIDPEDLNFALTVDGSHLVFGE
ncbi:MULTISPECIES: hypothetical protein [Bacteroides]|uniref:hypothetical protein n=1 Tax=Bacteroides TaxID=816 RepID=UPI000B3A575E|nr:MULTISPECIES: hypothetical protein [Bacteroides]MBM6946103.1 hypothetical protein [Bacteroides gallinaceum]OUO51321.1 hypothetical protein B5F78_13275 [Bacteroides sp. An279]